ncbi:MAG TPA: LacI family transcriptional regulator [Firmicutes bacterium]|nr:LacI family transcriptional regulator [Bacillota bacterium]
MSNREITIKDVAERANVSVSTVSRVLNGLDRVSDKTRTEVLKIIKELNYIPNDIAVSMITKKTKVIAVVVPNLENPFYTAVIRGTVEVTKKAGYFTSVISTNENEVEETDYFQGYLNRNVDGFILIGAHDKPDFYRNIKKHVVLVDRYIDNTNLDGVIIDNFKGAYEGTKNLLENGHTKIAVINGPRNFNDGIERYWGYYQAIKDYGIEIDECYHKQGEWSEDNGYQATLELMKLDNPPTAIFAANNLICMGTIKALRDLGLAIGEDISLVGFDENDLAEFIIPKITVVRRPTYEMGIQAAEMLLQKIFNNDSTTNNNPKKVVLGVELLKRGSVKNLNIR